MNRARILFAAALAALPLCASAGGTVIAVEGKAALARNPARVIVVEALPVQAGDTLAVQRQSKVQLQFDDDSLFSVPGPATFRIDAFDAPKAGPGRAVYTLVEGGVRTVTGRIGKRAQDVYELHTDLATITVKGSAYAAVRCRTQCAGARPGLYVRADQGLITVTNGAGTLQVRPGETGYVESPQSAPVRSPNSPFLDPVFASGFSFEERIDTGKEPQRIEQESPVSPS
jgi:hypothetical protein